MIYHQGHSLSILEGDCLDSLETLKMFGATFQTCITSPPYYNLRDYGHEKQIGLEASLFAYITKLVIVFRSVRKLLKEDGTLWVNMGDSYAGSGKDRCKPKDLIGVPWELAFALRNDGWYLRQDIIWSKPNPMPESVRDRCTKSHEYLFLLSKSPKYYFNSDAIRTPRKGLFKTERSRGNGKYRNPGNSFQPHTGLENPYTTANKRSVWTVSPKPFKEAHFATFPSELIEPCILAGSKMGDLILDPFGGSGTTGAVALKHGRNAILCELNPEYIKLIPQRVKTII